VLWQFEPRAAIGGDEGDGRRSRAVRAAALPGCVCRLSGGRSCSRSCSCRTESKRVQAGTTAVAPERRRQCVQGRYSLRGQRHRRRADAAQTLQRLDDDHRRAAVPTGKCRRRRRGHHAAVRFSGLAGGLLQQIAGDGQTVPARGVGQQPEVPDAVEPGGSTCSRKRRMNSAAVSVIVLWRVRPWPDSPSSGRSRRARRSRAGGCWRSPPGGCSATGRPAPLGPANGAWRRRPTRTGAAAPASRRRRMRRPAPRARRRSAGGRRRGRGEFFQEAAPEQAREHAHGQEEARPAGDPLLPVGRQAAAGTMPCTCGWCVSAEPQVCSTRWRRCARPDAWVGGDRQQRLGGHVEEQPIDHRLVLVGDLADRRWQREDDV